MKSATFSWAKRFAAPKVIRGLKRRRIREERRVAKYHLQQNVVDIDEIDVPPISRPYGYDAWELC